MFGGNPDLTEEESDTFTLSAIITPEALPNLRVSIDYFDIDVEDAIGAFGGSVDNILDVCYLQVQDINSTACQAVGRNSLCVEILLADNLVTSKQWTLRAYDGPDVTCTIPAPPADWLDRWLAPGSAAGGAAASSGI